MDGSLNSGALLAGRYRILARIGEGGFATVYKARDQRKHGKLVAIKEINMAKLSAQEIIEVTDTFNREISVLSWLSHKNLPCISDQFTDPEHWYIVMEYIEGQTLEDLLARSPKGRLSVGQTARIGFALCNVLSHLHNQSPAIIFRDVKPGNIMLTFWDRLYLIDFGIARRYRPGQVRDTGPLGSPGYAAPEQYGRTQTTTQTDIYGLGATLQTLLTGKEPLEIRQQGIPQGVRIPRKLQALISQMIDPDPSRRPRGMAEVKRALAPYVLPSGFQLWFLLQFGFMSMTQSHFVESPLAGLYSLLALALLVGSCIFAFLRAWRAASAGLSAKAATMIIGKQFLFSLLPVSFLTGCVSLLYALLVRPQISVMGAMSLWVYGAVVTLLALVFFLVWLNRRYEIWHPQRTPPPQAPSLQQHMQKRP